LRKAEIGVQYQSLQKLDPQKTWQTKKFTMLNSTHTLFDQAQRALKQIYDKQWQGKGNNLRTSRRENHSTQHDRKNLKCHIETSRHCGRKEKQGQRRESLIRKTRRQTATSDSAEFDA